MNILQNLWSEVAGKIFLITFASYLFSYLVYGGYIFAFFRERSLPFGLADFSIADLISIFPTAIITLINIIPKAFWDITKGIFNHLFIPLIVSLSIRLALNVLSIPIPIGQILAGYLVQAGMIIWAFGYLFPIIKKPKRLRFFIFVEIIGAVLLIISIPGPGGTLLTVPQPFYLLQQILSILLVILSALVILALPYYFGFEIAKTAIKLNLLTKIDRLTLSRPILKKGLRKINPTSEAIKNNSFRELWFTQKNLPIDVEPDVYEWCPTPDEEFYLIATFEKFVLIFVPGINSEVGLTLIVNRDVILSMEF
jgi:hypothetical protein